MLKFTIICALLGFSSACTMRSSRSLSANSNRPNIESGSLDIPIRLSYQQGPIPSASVSVGVQSRMNENLGNGIYRQHRNDGGFEVQAAAVPTFDGDANINGLQADVDTHASHSRKKVYLNGNPLDSNVDVHVINVLFSIYRCLKKMLANFCFIGYLG